jgi:hypothetical protein
MATVNTRIKVVQAVAFNGVNAGGAMSLACQAGYDKILRSEPDGIGGPAIVDKIAEFCRGAYGTQDWTGFLSVLTAAAANFIGYQRKSGVAEATGFVKHTIVAPVVYRAALNQALDSYMTAVYNFECQAADETKGFADMWTQDDAQAKPAYVSAARGGYRITAASFDPDGAAGAIAFYHLTAFSFAVELLVDKYCNDADVGYTAVDAEADGLTANGSISFEDAAISADQLTAQRLLSAGRGTLTLTVTQGGGAAAKTIALAGVNIEGLDSNAAPRGVTGFTLRYHIANDASVPLTLTGANPILAIT